MYGTNSCIYLLSVFGVCVSHYVMFPTIVFHLICIYIYSIYSVYTKVIIIDAKLIERQSMSNYRQGFLLMNTQ